MITIAELKLKILADLDKLKSDLQKLLKEKFKIGVEGDGDGKESGKQTGLLGLISKRLLPLGILFTLKPIQDLLKIMSGFLVIGILKLLEFFRWIKGIFPGAEEPTDLEKLGTEVDKEIARIAEEGNRILDGFREKSLIEALKLQDILKEVGIDTENAYITSANVIRAALEAQGIDTKNMSDEFLLALNDNHSERQAALDIMSGGITDLDKTTGNVNKLTDILVNKKINELADATDESGKLTAEEIVKGIDKVSVDEIKVAKEQVDLTRNLPQKIWDKVKGLAALIAESLPRFLGGGRGKVGDAIIKPSGEVIETHPDDTIIATKTPGALGGGTKTFNFYGVTPQEVIDVLKRELAVDVRRSSRF